MISLGCNNSKHMLPVWLMYASFQHKAAHMCLCTVAFQGHRFTQSHQTRKVKVHKHLQHKSDHALRRCKNRCPKPHSSRASLSSNLSPTCSVQLTSFWPQATMGDPLPCFLTDYKISNCSNWCRAQLWLLVNLFTVGMFVKIP